MVADLPVSLGHPSWGLLAAAGPLANCTKWEELAEDVRLGQADEGRVLSAPVAGQSHDLSEVHRILCASKAGLSWKP